MATSTLDSCKERFCHASHPHHLTNTECKHTRTMTISQWPEYSTTTQAPQIIFSAMQLGTLLIFCMGQGDRGVKWELVLIHKLHQYWSKQNQHLWIVKALFASLHPYSYSWHENFWQTVAGLAVFQLVSYCITSSCFCLIKMASHRPSYYSEPNQPSYIVSTIYLPPMLNHSSWASMSRLHETQVTQDNSYH